MSDLREALRHAREALPAANERETVICAIEGTHLRALVDALSAESAQEMTDEQIDRLDTFSLSWFAPRGVESVREFARAVEALVRGKT